MTTGMILGYLFIFFARILDMSLDTVRIILIVKGKRLIGAMLGFVTAMIWLVVIRLIFTELDNIGNMIAYAAGFATGNYIGSIFEEMIGLGDISVQVILNRCDDEVTNMIRESGFGVSAIECKGKQGLKTLLIIQIHRKQLKKLNRLIKKIDPCAFVTIMDTRKIVNGYFQSCKK